MASQHKMIPFKVIFHKNMKNFYHQHFVLVVKNIFLKKLIFKLVQGKFNGYKDYLFLKLTSYLLHKLYLF